MLSSTNIRSWRTLEVRLRVFLFVVAAGSLLAQSALYVSTLSTDGATTTSVYSTADRTRLAFTAARAGGVIVAPDGRSYFITDANGASIGAYNSGTALLTAAAATGGNPISAAVSPNGQRIYVAAYGGGIVSVHDARTLGLISSAATGFSPAAIIVHPDNSRFYIAHASDREVAVFNATTLRVAKRLVTGGGPVALAQLNPRTLLVLNTGAETVQRINLETDEIEGEFAAGPEPAAMALSAAGRLYVSNSTDSVIRIFDPAAGRQSGTIELPRCGKPSRCAVMSLAVDGTTLYAANSNANEVFAVDLATNTLIATFTTPVGPRWIAVGPRP